MKSVVIHIGVGILLAVCASCTQSYPYLFLTDNCRCEEYTYRDPQQRFEILFKAEYEVDERVVTTVEIEFHNRSNDTLSLQQAYLKGTSRNVRYQYNDKWVPLPYEAIAPQGSYRTIFQGGDSEVVLDPWLKIAGERTVLEIKGLMLGEKLLEMIRVELVPVNPKLTS